MEGQALAGCFFVFLWAWAAVPQMVVVVAVRRHCVIVNCIKGGGGARGGRGGGEGRRLVARLCDGSVLPSIPKRTGNQLERKPFAAAASPFACVKERRKRLANDEDDDPRRGFVRSGPGWSVGFRGAEYAVVPIQPFCG